MPKSCINEHSYLLKILVNNYFLKHQRIFHIEDKTRHCNIPEKLNDYETMSVLKES